MVSECESVYHAYESNVSQYIHFHRINIFLRHIFMTEICKMPLYDLEQKEVVVTQIKRNLTASFDISMGEGMCTSFMHLLRCFNH